jgi:hypothetical protein
MTWPSQACLDAPTRGVGICDPWRDGGVAGDGAVGEVLDRGIGNDLGGGR